MLKKLKPFGGNKREKKEIIINNARGGAGGWEVG